ncbi:MAG: ABC transporter substrate-binding protein [Streptosporangiales bacterium]
MASTRRHRLLALLAVAALVAGLGGCVESTESSGKGKNGISLVSDGQLTACTSLPYRPYEFSKNGKTVGFEIDLIDLVAKDLGVKQEIIDTPWGGIVSGEDFNTGKCDVAYGGMTITKQRAKVVDFTKPYVEVKQSLLVKKSSSINSLEDLKGKDLGAQLDTTGKIYAKRHEKKYGYTIVDFEDFGLLSAAVLTGKVDASIADSGILKYYVKHHQDTEIGAQYATGDTLGMAVKQGDKAMLNELNKVLDKAKKDGTYAHLYKKWFGTAPPKE